MKNKNSKFIFFALIDKGKESIYIRTKIYHYSHVTLRQFISRGLMFQYEDDISGNKPWNQTSYKPNRNRSKFSILIKCPTNRFYCIIDHFCINNNAMSMPLILLQVMSMAANHDWSEIGNYTRHFRTRFPLAPSMQS